MLVTLEKATADNGKAQLVLSIDSNGIDELPRLAGTTGQLMACDLRTSQEELPIEGEQRESSKKSGLFSHVNICTCERTVLRCLQTQTPQGCLAGWAEAQEGR